MALLRDLLTEARYRNRKKRRVLTNHTYYKRRKNREMAIGFDIVGNDPDVDAFLTAVRRIQVDESISMVIE